MQYSVNQNFFYGPEQDLCIYSLMPSTGLARVNSIGIETLALLKRCTRGGPAPISSLEEQAIGDLLTAGMFNTDKEHLANPFHGFLLSDETEGILDSPNKIKLEHIQSGDQTIAIIDNALSNMYVGAMNSWLSLLPYRQNDIDTHAQSEYRHWICAFEKPELYVNTVPILEAISVVGLEALRREIDGFDKMHAYSVPYGDVQHYHRDFGNDNGLTIVYHANAQWSRDWGGEMIFCNASGEPRIAVEFRPGRIIAFTGSVMHRAGVPNRNAKEARRTFVLQANRSKLRE